MLAIYAYTCIRYRKFNVQKYKQIHKFEQLKISMTTWIKNRI